MKFFNNKNIVINKCYKCNKNITNIDKQEICEKCKKIFHKNCINENKNKNILCINCEKNINLNLSKIDNYFNQHKLINNKIEKSKEINKNNNNNILSQDYNIYIKISQKINKSLKPILSYNGHIKLPKTLTSKQKEILLKSLYRGLEVKGIKFNDDLIYLDNDCPEIMNNTLLENGIKEISTYIKKIYNTFKNNSRKGIYGPLKIIEDPIYYKFNKNK